MLRGATAHRHAGCAAGYGLLVCRFWVAFVATVFSVSVAAAEDGGEGDGPPDTEQPTRVDTAHDYVTARVQESAQWFDTFFDDPNFVGEDASTRLRVRTEAFFSQKDEEKYSAKFNLKLHLPNLSRKFKNQTSLLLGGDDTLDDPDLGEANSIDNALNDATDDPTVGLQYFLLIREKLNINVLAGVKLSGPSLFAGPRVSYIKVLGENTQLRFTERLRWYTDEGWD